MVETWDKNSHIKISALPHQKRHGTQVAAMAARLGLKSEVFL
jgi:hypothetical protein